MVTDDSSVSSYTQFPESVSGQLTAMADWLIAQSRDEFMNVYARIRATVMLKSLQLLKEQQKTGSGGSVQGMASSPVTVIIYFVLTMSTVEYLCNKFLGRNIILRKLNKLVLSNICKALVHRKE